MSYRLAKPHSQRPSRMTTAQTAKKMAKSANHNGPSLQSMNAA